MKVITLSLFLISLSFGIFAQSFELPKNYKLEKAEDYAPLEEDFIKAFDWLMETPLNEQKKLRTEVNAFMLEWLTGSPNVSLTLSANIITFMGSTPDLLIVFMGGWGKHALVSRDFENMVAGNVAGIEAVTEFYTKNKGVLKKDKNVEKYIKMKDKGELKQYIEKNI